MKESTTDIAWPSGGLNQSNSFDKQPAGTTPLAQNVRTNDPVTQRDRGGQRYGLSKYCPVQIGPVLIQDIDHLVYSGSGTSLSPRSIRGIAVAGGNVSRFSSSGTSAITNGAGALSLSAKTIFSAQLFQQLYFADGANYKYYDGPTDSILPLVASVGSLPTDSGGNKARLVCVWRNRLVFSGLPLDPANWFMSAAGAPTNWNYNPIPAVETMAVAGNNSTAGMGPDVIHCLIPYSDEILVMLGDHQMYQMTGDPASGGRIDLVSAAIGGAWGMPYCRDGSGTLYFVSSKGSIYKYVPGGVPERISDAISSLVLAFPLDTSICRMEWNETLEGFHLWVSPVGSPGATAHYFYEVGTQAWWQDVYANNNHNPVATHVFDGDAESDRVVLLGSWDGFIRKVDLTFPTDDGTSIGSYVFVGPINDRQGNAIFVDDLQCSLDDASGDVAWSLLSGSNAQAALNATPVFSGTFRAGRNRSQYVRGFGHAHFIKLFSASSSRWALEYLHGTLRTPEGRAPQRMF